MALHHRVEGRAPVPCHCACGLRLRWAAAPPWESRRERERERADGRRRSYILLIIFGAEVEKLERNRGEVDKGEENQEEPLPVKSDSRDLDSSTADRMDGRIRSDVDKVSSREGDGKSREEFCNFLQISGFASASPCSLPPPYTHLTKLRNASLTSLITY